MAPHSLETILKPPQWPTALSQFVTACLMWDPKHRPTSLQAMNHEYFVDAVDPLIRPKSRLLGRKQPSYDHKQSKEATETPKLTSRPSWFRKSLISHESAPAVPQHTLQVHQSSPVGAPMPILPSIRPISPLSNAVTAEARTTHPQGVIIAQPQEQTTPEKKKIGRQLSLASHGNHYTDSDRAVSGISSPINGQKESFFSHLRKRARRLSGRNQLPVSPRHDDVEANAGCGPWQSGRSSMAFDGQAGMMVPSKNDFTELDKALSNVRYSLDAASQARLNENHVQKGSESPSSVAMPTGIKRQPSQSRVSPIEPATSATGPISSRTRRALHLSTHPAHRYETPDEEEELLDEALHGAQRAAGDLNKASTYSHTELPQHSRQALAVKDSNANKPGLAHSQSAMDVRMLNPYPTPSPSAKRSGMLFNQALMAEPVTPATPAISIVGKLPRQGNEVQAWPTPPNEENEWAASASASIFAAGCTYR